MARYKRTKKNATSDDNNDDDNNNNKAKTLKQKSNNNVKRISNSSNNTKTRNGGANNKVKLTNNNNNTSSNNTNNKRNNKNNNTNNTSATTTATTASSTTVGGVTQPPVPASQPPIQSSVSQQQADVVAVAESETGGIQTRSNNRANKTQLNEFKEPRKRRIASLNAEALLHIYSTPNTANNNNLNNTNNEANANNSDSNVKNVKRTNRSTSRGSSKIDIDEQDVTTANDNTNNKQQQQQRKTNKKETKTSNNTKKNLNNNKKLKNTTDNEGDNNENDDDDEDADEGDVEEVKDEKVEQIKKNGDEKKEKEEEKEDDDDSDEDDEEDGDDDDDKKRTDNKTLNKKKAAAKTKAKPAAAKTLNKSKKRQTSILSDIDLANLNAPRPKREASMRASAMIIQTNEIEKARYQYNTFLTTTSSTNHVNNANDNHNNTNNANSMVKKGVTKSSRARNLKLSKKQKLSKNNGDDDEYEDEDDEDEDQEDDDDDDEVYKEHSKPRPPKRQYQTKGRNNRHHEAANDEDLSAKQDTIDLKSTVSETNNSTVNDVNNLKLKTKYLELTQENLTEHNKLHSNTTTSASNCSQYNNNTRDYILKWTSNNSIDLDDKPFPVGQIPLETFGTKILNAPQYLLHKSKSSSSSTLNAPSVSATATAAAATTTNNDVSSCVAVAATSNANNSTHHSHHHHHHNHHHHHHHHHHHNNKNQANDPNKPNNAATTAANNTATTPTTTLATTPIKIKQEIETTKSNSNNNNNNNNNAKNVTSTTTNNNSNTQSPSANNNNNNTTSVNITTTTNNNNNTNAGSNVKNTTSTTTSGTNLNCHNSSHSNPANGTNHTSNLKLPISSSSSINNNNNNLTSPPVLQTPLHRPFTNTVSPTTGVPSAANTAAAPPLNNQQLSSLQLMSQIEQAQLAQLQQSQNTAFNNLAAALNLTISPTAAPLTTPASTTQQAQAAAAAALFQQNAFTNLQRPFLPILSFTTTPWQIAAAAAAAASATPTGWNSLQPLPERCIIQPAPVHVFQQPTVNVVVKPQTQPIYGSHHKGSHKSQKSLDHVVTGDELKITVNPLSTKQSSSLGNTFHKSTSAPTIGVTSNAASYQVKIKTEKAHKSSSYEKAEAASIANSLPAAAFNSLLDEHQLQQANFLMPSLNCNQAMMNFAKMLSTNNQAKTSQTIKKQQQSPQSTQSSPTSKRHNSSSYTGVNQLQLNDYSGIVKQEQNHVSPNKTNKLQGKVKEISPTYRREMVSKEIVSPSSSTKSATVKPPVVIETICLVDEDDDNDNKSKKIESTSEITTKLPVNDTGKKAMDVEVTVEDDDLMIIDKVTTEATTTTATVESCSIVSSNVNNKANNPPINDTEISTTTSETTLNNNNVEIQVQNEDKDDNNTQITSTCTSTIPATVTISSHLNNIEMTSVEESPQQSVEQIMNNQQQQLEKTNQQIEASFNSSSSSSVTCSSATTSSTSSSPANVENISTVTLGSTSATCTNTNQLNNYDLSLTAHTIATTTATVITVGCTGDVPNTLPISHHNQNEFRLHQNKLTVNSFNDEDTLIDNENSISSFSLCLKANKKFSINQLWKLNGKPFQKLISINPNNKPIYRECYPSIIHEKENEEIKIFDCILLRSSSSTDSSSAVSTIPIDSASIIAEYGPNNFHLASQTSTTTNSAVTTLTIAPTINGGELNTPTSTMRTLSTSDVFIAKVSAFWRDEITNKIMMEILWYYSPNQTDLKGKWKFDKQELFASKHYDVLDVDCIDDKCYVLTFNEFCRWKTQEKYALTYNSNMNMQQQSRLVPKLIDYPRADRQPSISTASENVFYCRYVYDFRSKRLLKNPQ